MLSDETLLHVRAMTRAFYVVVDEEDRFITQFHEQMVRKKRESAGWVYNASLGLRPLLEYINDWKSRKHEVDKQTASLNDALIKIYTDTPNSAANFYIITDPERWLAEPLIVRRILNIIHQGHQDIFMAKCLIFISHRRYIPEKLQRYVEVVNETDLAPDEIVKTVGALAEHLKVPTIPPNPAMLFNGLTTYEIESSMSQAVVASKMKHYPQDIRIIEPEFIARYKRQQIRKSDLVQLVNTSDTTFASVGGAQRFKKWANETKACWTEEGQKYGLLPPRGVLMLGVYGCGKSLSAKALANEWGLPLVQFEMGRVRSSAVGESEANLYRALRIVESVAPCIMWIDEAEKSLAGAASSAQSDAGVTSRLLGILSTWTQESRVPVSLVMTANNLKTLPTEMVNRIPERFFFDLPSEEDRIDIIKIHGRKMGQDISKFPLQHLAELSKNLVGREIEQAMHSAMVKSFNAKKPGLNQEILAHELENKSRITSTMTDEITEILQWVGYDPKADDGIRAHLASDHRSEHFSLVSNT